MSRTELTVELVQNGEVQTLAVSGELDLASLPILQQAIADDLDPTSDAVIDLSGLTFTDSSGIGGLLAATRTFAEAGRHLRLANVSGNVARVFRLSAVDTILEFVDPLG